MPALAALVAAVVLSSQSPPPPGLLISRQLAESRGLHAGSEIRLATDPSGAHARVFRIAGIYEPTPDPLRFAVPQIEARMHLPDLLALEAETPGARDRRGVTAINLALRRPQDAVDFVRDVSSRVPGLVARATSAPDERASTFVVVDRFHLAIAIVTVAGSAMFLLALMVMLVDERRSTVGILRLLGFTRRRILLQVFVEGAAIALAGALGGILFALASERLFNRFFQWRYDTTLVFLRVTPSVAWRTLAMALPFGIAASLVASWTLLRQQLLALIRR
jgi:putative ABC transport system permease protein